MSQEKSKTMPMQIFFGGGGGVKVVYYGICASSDFPGCFMPQFQSESWCTAIQMEMSCVFLCKSNSFPFQ